MNPYATAVRSILALLLCCGPVGCSLLDRAAPEESVRYSGLKGAVEGREEKVLTLSKKKFSALLGEYSSFSALRLVQVFDSLAEDKFPRYRVFGVSPESVWRYMGLENADLLLAAHDYVIFNPSQFVRYAQILTQQEEGFVEIQRLGKPIRFKYRWEE